MNPIILGSLVDFPRRGGAYALVIHGAQRLDVKTAGRPAGCLSPGLYLYGGNAHGPGGLQARIRRHLRTPKPQHWHIDQLTARFSVVAVGASQTYIECDLLARTLELAGAHQPLPGFGSSDCQRCTSHLVRLPGGHDLAHALQLAGCEFIWLRPAGVL